jgi:hypothetical protein
MNPLVVLQILNAALALAETGTEVASFLSQISARIQADQAAGVDISAADWSFLDAAAAANVAEAEQLAGHAGSSIAS